MTKIKIDDIKCPAGYSQEMFEQAVREALLKKPEGHETANRASPTIRILKKSLDARKKPRLFYVFSVELSWDEPIRNDLPESLLRIRERRLSEGKKPEENRSDGRIRRRTRPVVVGCGPAGLFAALTLAVDGYQPVLIERGKAVDERIKDILAFWENGILLPESNVQFGEGGAGTFSDGKLTTGIKDPACRMVLETFVDAGAPEEILTMAKPHIGTDLLRDIIKKIRETIERLGGTVLFETRLERIHAENGRISGIEVARRVDSSSDKADLRSGKADSQPSLPEDMIKDEKQNSFTIETDTVILAIGHSARDTIRMLLAEGVEMQAKPFSMGVRIEHLQKAVNESQYGRQTPEIERTLPAAEYKLSCHLPNGRDVYTFCMCPGGQVIASASGEQQVVTNGMSLHARAQTNANSAILVNVTPSDYDSDSPLSGMDFQEKWEHKAFLAGGASYKAPAQSVGGFLKNSPDRQDSQGKLQMTENGNTSVMRLEQVVPTYAPGVTWTNLAICLPSFVTQSLRLALPLFNARLAGFASPGAVLTGIESRSSSPVRILRDTRRMSSIEGLYPCGEGAGYAGGIISASVDGIACARAYRSERNTEDSVSNH